MSEPATQQPTNSITLADCQLIIGAKEMQIIQLRGELEISRQQHAIEIKALKAEVDRLKGGGQVVSEV